MSSVHRLRQSGFTLLELVVSITISMIVVAFAAMFIATPVQSYLAQSRRAELVVSADMVVRNLDRDIRNALPNSVRVTQNGAVWALELLEVVDVARYRDVNTVPPGGGMPNQELDFSVADKQFGAYAMFSPASHPSNPNARYLVINNDPMMGADAYSLTKVTTPTTAMQIVVSANINTPNEDEITLNAPFKFNAGSPTHQMYLVSGPVTYLCDPNNHTLVRYAGYSIAANQAARNSAAKLINAGATTIATIATNINTCGFDYQLNNALHNRLVGVRLSVSQAGENLPVFMQVPMEHEQ